MEKHTSAHWIHAVEFKRLRRKGFKAGTNDDTQRLRSLIILKIANEPSQIPRDVKPWANVELIPGKITSSVENIPYNNCEIDSWISQPKVPDDNEILSKEHEGDNLTRSHEIKDVDVVRSEDQNGDDRTRP